MKKAKVLGCLIDIELHFGFQNGYLNTKRLNSSVPCYRTKFFFLHDGSSSSHRIFQSNLANNTGVCICQWQLRMIDIKKFLAEWSMCPVFVLRRNRMVPLLVFLYSSGPEVSVCFLTFSVVFNSFFILGRVLPKELLQSWMRLCLGVEENIRFLLKSLEFWKNKCQ